jgi:hypothetical protein
MFWQHLPLGWPEAISRNLGGQGLGDSVKAITQLQQIDAEIAALLIEVENYGFETAAAAVVRVRLREMQRTAQTLWQAIERSRSSADERALLAEVNDDRMLLAAQLIAEISQDFEAGRIRTDQRALATYLLVLNQVMESLDRSLSSRQAKD